MVSLSMTVLSFPHGSLYYSVDKCNVYIFTEGLRSCIGSLQAHNHLAIGKVPRSPVLFVNSLQMAKKVELALTFVPYQVTESVTEIHVESSHFSSFHRHPSTQSLVISY